MHVAGLPPPPLACMHAGASRGQGGGPFPPPPSSSSPPPGMHACVWIWPFPPGMHARTWMWTPPRAPPACMRMSMDMLPHLLASSPPFPPHLYVYVDAPPPVG